MTFVKDLDSLINSIHVAGYPINTDNAHGLEHERKERIKRIKFSAYENILPSARERQKRLKIIKERCVVHSDDLGSLILLLLVLTKIDLLDREKNERRDNAV